VVTKEERGEKEDKEKGKKTVSFSLVVQNKSKTRRCEIKGGRYARQSCVLDLIPQIAPHQVQ